MDPGKLWQGKTDAKDKAALASHPEGLIMKAGMARLALLAQRHTYLRIRLRELRVNTQCAWACV